MLYAGILLSIDDGPIVDEADLVLNLCVSFFELDGTERATLKTADGTAKGEDFNIFQCFRKIFISKCLFCCFETTSYYYRSCAYLSHKQPTWIMCH